MKGEELELSFGTEKIYDEASFLLEAKDKVGVVGVNGAGKSTLFKVILGEQELDRGKLTLPSLRVGYLSQEIVIDEEHQDITVWDYILSGRPVDELQEKLNLEYEKLAKYPDSQAIMTRIDELNETMESFDLGNMDNEMLRIIEKMGLDDLTDRKMTELSGGQKSKVAFARVLFMNAGLLLLDEPTNHLDVSTKDFVANYLRNYQGMVMIISHDKEFLDGVVNKILFLDKTTHKFQVYSGNYSEFRRRRAKEKAEKEKRISEQEREIQRIQEFVERARAAKRSNTALIRQGHVREKMLERKMAELETREAEYGRVRMNITPREIGGKMPLEVQNLSFHYPGADPLYRKLDFNLTRGEKFLIVGENGAGKSTLLKLIVGELTPTEGSVIMGTKTEVAYYAQELEILNEKETVLDNVKSYDYTETEVRGMLANFLFNGEEINKHVAVMSPGEKARVALCKILMKRANLVILDEPTNHFDPETQKIIGENFRDFQGTLMVVSHSPSFVEQIGVTRMLIIEDGKAKVKNFSRELLEYYYYLNSDLV
jgi:ATP-binding cassette subfamily F protein 3